jgi:predicted component of type VI protein secretion system
MVMQLRNTSTDEIVQLSDGLTIGRHPDCGFVVSDNSVSRIHCKIAWHNDAFVLTDQNSSNGCFVDSRKQNIIRLHAGAVVTLGEIQFDVVDEAAAKSSSVAEHSERAHQRREMLEEQSSGGFGDLSQQPFIVRAFAFAISIGVMLGVVYLVRKAGEVF